MKKQPTNSPTHPGSLIKKELKDRGLSQKEFAEALGLRPSHISEIINGNRRVTISLAEKVDDWLGIPAKMLLDLQLTYDMACKSGGTGNVEECRANSFLDELSAVVDVRALLKGHGKLTPIEKVSLIKSRYHITTVEALRSCYSRLATSCFRRSGKTGLDERMIATWVVMAKAEARAETVEKKFDPSSRDELCGKLCRILHENIDTVARVTKTLNDYGVVFKVVSKLDHASIDGYSFVNGDTPCIVLTLRYNRIDNLAFTLMHEVGHIFLGHTTRENQMISVDTRSIDEDLCDAKELEADAFAAEWLIPGMVWRLAPTSPMIPFVIQKRYSEWAEKNGLNKWIVLGRLSHETGIYKFKADGSRAINKEGGMEVE